MGHTGLPWKIKWSHEKGIAIGTEEVFFLDVLAVDIGFEEAQRIAEEIVLASNAHKDLLAACEALADAIPEDNMDNMDSSSFKDRAYTIFAAARKAKAAIAKGTVDAPAKRTAPHGQSETFQSLCDKGKNPMPLGGESCK